MHSPHNTPIPERVPVGVLSGFAVAAMCIAYAGVLAMGLLTLPSPDQAIQDPWFTLMELLILGIAPAMVGVTVGVHGMATDERKSLSLLSIIFMSMCAVVTCCVHFSVLTLSNHPAVAGHEWANLMFSFRWPSVAYALDILAWDLFFALAALFAGLAIHGAGLARFISALLYASAALAFVGLAGIPLENMNIRNIGIIGYVVLFPVAAVLLARMSWRQRSRGAA